MMKKNRKNCGFVPQGKKQWGVTALLLVIIFFSFSAVTSRWTGVGLLRVEGQSMDPLIWDGDWVVSLPVTPKDGDIVVAWGHLGGNDPDERYARRDRQPSWLVKKLKGKKLVSLSLVGGESDDFSRLRKVVAIIPVGKARFAVNRETAILVQKFRKPVPKGEGKEDLNSVFFIDSNTGWVVSTGGDIKYSTDGGVTWGTQSSGFVAPFYGVDFADAAKGWIVGAGIILKTINGGSIWTDNYSFDGRGIDFVDSFIGWAVGDQGKIIHTTDGGGSWTSQTSGITASILRDVFFIDANTGWVVGDDGVILKTTDGGSSWSNITPDNPALSFLYSVFFVDSSTGWVVGDDGEIAHTTDGGSTWVQQTSGTQDRLRGVSFVDSTHGWAVGDSGTILHTTDGGANWSSQTSGTTSFLQDVVFTDSAHGWAVGAGGTILKYSTTYQSAGTATVSFDGTNSYNQWQTLTKSETTNGKTVNYYGASDSDSSCPSAPAVADAGTASNWTANGWSALSFSGNDADLSSFSHSRYLCLGVYLATDDTAVTPQIDSLSLSYVKDTAPTVSIASPTTSSTYITNSSSVTVSGTASDSVGSVSSVSSSSGKTNSGTAAGWSFNETLSEGTNTFTYTATDDAGQTATASLTITLDSVDPAVAVTSSATTNSSSYTISGAASDSGGTGVASVSVSGAASGNGTASGTTSWSKTVTLAEGANTLTVTATDNAGNTAAETFTVTYTPPTSTTSSPASASSSDSSASTSSSDSSSGSSTAATAVSDSSAAIADTTAPATPSSFTIKVADGSAKISWSNPADSDFSQVKIYRQQGGASDNANSIDVTETNSTTATEALVENLKNDIEYTFWLTAVDISGNESPSTEKLTVVPGKERVYKAPDFLNPDLKITQSSSASAKNQNSSASAKSQSSSGSAKDEALSSVIGQGVSSQDKAPLVFAKDGIIKFALVDKDARLQKITDVSASSGFNLKPEDIAKMGVKILAAPTADGRWAVIFTANDALYFAQSKDAQADSFEAPELVALGVSPWQLKLLKNKDGSFAVAALSADRKDIAVYKKGANGWSSKDIASSRRPILGFDVVADGSGYSVAYETTVAQSKSFLGTIINAFKVEATVVAQKANGAPRQIFRGKKTVAPKLVLGADGELYAVFWDSGREGGIKYFGSGGGGWKQRGVIAPNGRDYSFEGRSQLSAFWDEDKGLAVVWNGGKDSPTTYFGYANNKLGKTGRSRIYRSLNAPSVLASPKISSFGRDRFVYIIGNSGFIYIK